MDSPPFLAEHTERNDERLHWVLKAADYGMHEAAKAFQEGMAPQLGPEAVVAWAEVVKRTN